MPRAGAVPSCPSACPAPRLGWVEQGWLVRPCLAIPGEALKLPVPSPRKLLGPAVLWCVEKILIITVLMRTIDPECRVSDQEQ